MNDVVRRSLRWALALSLMLHVLALSAPGWRLPWLERERTRLDVMLAPLPLPAVAPVTQPAPQPKPEIRPKPRPAAVPDVARARAVEPSVEPAQLPPDAATETRPPPPELPAAPAASAPEEASAAVPPAPSFPGVWPRRGRIEFAVTRGEDGFVVGRAEHVWSHDGASYDLRATTETTGLAAFFKPVKVTQRSRGVFVPGGLQPLEFDSARDGRPTQSLRIDPAQQRIFSSSGMDHAYPGQTQDLLSIFYQLGALPLDAYESALTLATGRKVASYALRILDTVTLDTPFGVRAAWHLALPGANNDESTEVWLDTLTRLPLRIRHRDRKGEVFDQTATAVELEGTE